MLKKIKQLINKQTIIIFILVIVNYFLFDLHNLFKESDFVPIGYENATNPLQMYVLDLTMYINYVLFSLIVFLTIQKQNLLLFLLAVTNLILWSMEFLDFLFYRNQGYLNLKDPIIGASLMLIIFLGIRTWKKNKDGKTEVINVTNLALLKWFIPRTEAEKALKNSQRNLELEQKLLRSQMNPHFIFNSLTSIQNFIYTEKPEVASAYLGKFAKLMRLILENSREEFIPFEKEVETLQLYLELQKVRFGNRFEYEILIDPLIDIEEVAVPPMFAQPFIENSLEHGILHKSEKGEIKIRFILKDDSILFEVQDNGIGRTKAAKINRELKSDHRSFATKITEERLALIDPNSKVTEMVSVVDVLNEIKEVCGTRASFNIPFKYI